eukprot:Nk52_evm12s272 gene=Nk52_evmTU12s272
MSQEHTAVLPMKEPGVKEKGVSSPSQRKWKVVITWKKFFHTLKESTMSSFEYDREQYSSWVQSIPFKRIAIALLPFLCYLLVFQNYSALRNLSGLGQVKIPNMTFLPAVEKTIWFGHLPHQILARHTNVFLDLFAALVYVLHFTLPLIFTIYLYASGRRQDWFFYFWVFGWVNFLAVIVQFFFPTAPPWFTDSAVYDDGELIEVGAPEAGFERVDSLFGMHFFHNLYSKSPLPFGAYPSLHVAWPTVILACGPWFGKKVGIFHVIWIMWASIYANHHYFTDGISAVILTYTVRTCALYIYSPFLPEWVNRGSEFTPLPYSRNSDIPSHEPLLGMSDSFVVENAQLENIQSLERQQHVRQRSNPNDIV